MPGSEYGTKRIYQPSQGEAALQVVEYPGRTSPIISVLGADGMERDAIGGSLSAVIDVSKGPYNAKVDGRLTAADCSITNAGSGNPATITSATAAFKASDVGKTIMIGVHIAGNDLSTTTTPFVGTIALVQSGTAATLSQTAPAVALTNQPAAIGSDDTSAWTAASAALSAAGGGSLYLPNGVSIVKASISGIAPFSFNALRGFELWSPGGMLVDATVYGATDANSLFYFSLACDAIRVRGIRVAGQRIDLESNGASGLTVFDFTRGCTDIQIAARVFGCRVAFRAAKTFADPDSYRCAHIALRLFTEATYYGISTQYSGDDLVAEIHSDLVARAYFPYGIRNHRVRAYVKNNRRSSIIGPYLGCEDVELYMYSRDSDGRVNGDAPVVIEYRPDNGVPVIHRGIKVHVDIKNAVGANTAWGSFLGGGGVAFRKTLSDGVTLDTTDRGHVLDGCEISGSIDQVTGKRPINSDFFGFVGSEKLQGNLVIRTRETSPDSPPTLSTLPPGFYRAGDSRLHILTAGEGVFAETAPRGGPGWAGSSPASGEVQLASIPLRQGDLVSKIVVIATGAATAPTLIKLGLYSKAGVRLAVSADSSALFNTSDKREISMLTPYLVPTDDLYYIAFLGVATTNPPIARTGSFVNMYGLAIGSGVRPAAIMTGQADLPATVTFANATNKLWAGVL